MKTQDRILELLNILPCLRVVHVCEETAEVKVIITNLCEILSRSHQWPWVCILVFVYLHACLPIRVDISGTGAGHRLGRFVGLSVHVGNLGRMVIFGYFRLFLVIYWIVLAPGQPLRGGGLQASWKDMRQGSRKWRYIIVNPKRMFLFSLWPIFTKTYVLGTLKPSYQMLQKLCKYSFIFLSHGRDRL